MDSLFSQKISKEAFSQASDLKDRIVFTLLALLVYRIGTYIPLPGLDPAIIEDLAKRYLSGSGFLGMFNMFSGGALSRMTVFALNLMPYISASIVVQLMTMVIPSWESLKKEGVTGRQRLNQYTRILTIFVCTFHALALCTWLRGIPNSPVVINSNIFTLIAVVSLVCGTMFLVWLGEQMTSRGIGNGSSILIFAGIVANMPSSVMNIIQLGKAGALSNLAVTAIFGLAIAVILFVVFMERAQRRVPINYPQRQAMMQQGRSMEMNHLPLKINSANVIPPIFAYAMLSLPVVIVGALAGPDNEWANSFVSLFMRESVPYSVCLVLMIVFFSFFYTAVVFNPVETADNLKKAGGFIPGVRPGQATAEYLDYILTRLTSVGALYMALVCLIPSFVSAHFGVHFIFGGTGILIIVGVTIDTITQIYTHILSHQYRGVLRKAGKM